MAGKSRQGGLTLLGFIMVLAVLGIFAFVGMKLFPVYVEYYSVVTDMKGIQAEPGVSAMSPTKIKDLLFRRFYVSYVESVKKENVTVTRQNGYNLRVQYEVRRPLVYNLDFVAKFDKSVELTRQGSVD
jgi:Tfp pilus assembly major pilin PilA